MRLPSSVAPETWRLLTIVFVDVVGSTPLSVLLDGEDYVALIDRYQAITDPLIEKHNGFLGRDEGDGRFIWFGWPQAGEDDAERAVRMALDLRLEMRELATVIKQELGVELAVRVGIHTGEIIVREAAAGRPNLLGAAANIAAKVQAACPPGGVLASEATADLVRPRFALERAEHLELEGLDGHLVMYDVVDELEASAEPAANQVGRAPERALLADYWRKVRAGGSESALIVGEAGMGKTTLLQSFLGSYGLSASRLEIHGDDHRQGESFAALLTALGQWPLWTDETISNRLLNAETRTATLDEIVEHLAACAAEGPVLVVVEDAHWLDPSSSEAVGRIVSAQIPGVLVLIATRLSSLLFSDEIKTVPLGPLTDDELREILERNEIELTDADLTSLLAQTAGNPFFATELARSSQLEASGTRRALLPHSGVPIVVQQALRAQLDRSATAASLASTAAVLGRTFEVSQLVSAHGALTGQAAIDDDLAWLEDASIVSALDGETYRFRHALVRQLAYDLPVREQLRLRHSAVADVLLDKGGASPALLGLHLDSAGRWAEAADAKLDAARECRAAGAFREGSDLLDRVLLLLEKEPADERLRDRQNAEIDALELRSIIGAALDEKLYSANPLERARLNVLLEEHGDQATRARAVTRDWASAMVMSDLRRGGGLLRELSHLSRSDEVAWNMARHFRATHMMYRGNYRYAAPTLTETALSLATLGLRPEFRASWSTADDPVSVALSRVPPVLWMRGEAEQAHAIAEQAAHEAATIAGPSAAMAAAHVKANTALYCELSGNGHEAMQLGGEIIKVGAGPGLAFWEQIGQLHQLVGGVILEPHPERLAQLHRAAQSLENVARLFAPVLYLEAARGYLSQNLLSEANLALDGAAGIAEETGAYWLWSETLRLRAHTSGSDEKVRLLSESTAWAQRQGARVIELRALGDLIEVDPAIRIGDSLAMDRADEALAGFPSPDHYPECHRLAELLA